MDSTTATMFSETPHPIVVDDAKSLWTQPQLDDSGRPRICVLSFADQTPPQHRLVRDQDDRLVRDVFEGGASVFVVVQSLDSEDGPFSLWEFDRTRPIAKQWSGRQLPIGVTMRLGKPHFVFLEDSRIWTSPVDTPAFQSWDKMYAANEPISNWKCSSDTVVIQGQQTRTITLLDSSLSVLRTASRRGDTWFAASARWVCGFGSGCGRGALFVPLEKDVEDWRYERDRLSCWCAAALDDERFVCGWEDGTLTLMDCGKRGIAWEVQSEADNDRVTTASIDPARNLVVSGRKSGSIVATELSTGTNMWSERTVDGPVEQVSVLGGHVAVVDAFSVVSLLRIESGDLAFALLGHMGSVRHCAEIPTQNAIVTADEAGRVIYWELGSRKRNF